MIVVGGDIGGVKLFKGRKLGKKSGWNKSRIYNISPELNILYYFRFMTRA